MGPKKFRETGAGGYLTARSMYGFAVDPAKPLGPQAESAAYRIYDAGTMIRDRRIAPGTNNPMADFAAAAFDENDLAALAAGSPQEQAFGRIISLRQAYGEAIDREDDSGNWDNYWTHTDKLEAIVAEVQALRAAGWNYGLK